MTTCGFFLNAEKQPEKTAETRRSYICLLETESLKLLLQNPFQGNVLGAEHEDPFGGVFHKLGEQAKRFVLLIPVGI